MDTKDLDINMTMMNDGHRNISDQGWSQYIYRSIISNQRQHQKDKLTKFTCSVIQQILSQGDLNYSFPIQYTHHLVLKNSEHYWKYYICIRIYNISNHLRIKWNTKV